jgi:hypothetical protein
LAALLECNLPRPARRQNESAPTTVISGVPRNQQINGVRTAKQIRHLFLAQTGRSARSPGSRAIESSRFNRSQALRKCLTELPLRGILPVCVYGGLLQFTLQQINGAACRTSF